MTTATVFAQEENSSAMVVQGPIYKVIGADSGPIIMWRGKPIDRNQVVSLDDRTLAVNNEDGKERLRLYLKEDGTLEKVIDRKWQKLPEAYAQLEQDFDWGAPRTVTFANGLVFNYVDGEARAYFEGNPVTVTGARGSYRIKTEEFEAGISFGPRYGDRIYRYLTQ